MKYRAALGTKDSFIKRKYEERLSEGKTENILILLGGIENVNSQILFKNKDGKAFFGLARLESDDEYEYLFFCEEALKPKEEFFCEFAKEITEKELFAICEKEEIELE